jgi:hypothetical protein
LLAAERGGDVEHALARAAVFEVLVVVLFSAVVGRSKRAT